MRIESSVTSVSWIPSESMTGLLRVPVDLGVGHYDDPLPDHIDDLEALRQADRFRFANDLSAWIEVQDGRIVDYGYSGAGHIGSTTLALGVGHITIPAVSFPDIQAEPVVGENRVTFTQTTGGRTGAPLPRTINRPPFIKITAPTVWTTLSLTLHTDGSHDFEVTGASKMPRHWIYDENMDLVPLLARDIPTLDNGGVVLRPDGGMDVMWRLREGVRWHDGTPFTSADIQFTVEAINDPNHNPESTDGFDRIDSVSTPDALTAVVHYRAGR